MLIGLNGLEVKLSCCRRDAKVFVLYAEVQYQTFCLQPQVRLYAGA